MQMAMADGAGSSVGTKSNFSRISDHARNIIYGRSVYISFFIIHLDCDWRKIPSLRILGFSSTFLVTHRGEFDIKDEH